MFYVSPDGVCSAGSKDLYNTTRELEDLKTRVVVDFLSGPCTNESIMNTLHDFEMGKMMVHGDHGIKRELNLSKNNLMLYKLINLKAELDEALDPLENLRRKANNKLAEIYAFLDKNRFKE